MKKIINWSIAGITTIGIAVGSIFGLANYSNLDDYDKGSQYNKRFEIQVSVDQIVGQEESISEIINLTQARLDLVGYNDAIISQIDNTNFSIAIDLDSVNLSADIYSYEHEEVILTEILNFYNWTLNQNNVEFRTIDGQQLFQWSSQEQISGQFVTPYYEAPEGQQVNDEDPSYNPYTLDIVRKDSAVAVHKGNGSHVEFMPSSTVKRTEWQELWLFLVAAHEDLNPFGTSINIWFGYSEIDYILSQLGINDDPYTYMMVGEKGHLVEPFFVSTINYDVKLSEHEDTIIINGDWTKDEADLIASRMNLATKDYKLNYEGSNFVEAQRNDVFLRTSIILFITIIALMAFMFVWYFGLLGALAGAIMSVFALFAVAMVFIISIPLTGALFIGAVLITFVVAYMIWTVLKSIKTSAKHKLNTKVSMKLAYKAFTLENSTIFFVTTFLLFLFGTLMTPFIMFALFFAALMLISSVLFVVVALIPALAITQSMFNNDYDKNKKWCLIFGENFGLNISLNSTVDKAAKFTSNQSIKVVSLITVAISIISLGVFGILSITTDSGFNKKYDYKDQYRYDIVMVQRIEHNDGLEGQDPFNQSLLQSQVKSNQSEIHSILSSNGIGIEESKLIRDNNMWLAREYPPLFPGADEWESSFSYGVSIYSDQKITTEMFDIINNELLVIETNVDENWIRDWEEGYILLEKQSLVNIQNEDATLLTNTTNQSLSNASISAMILMPFILVVLLLLLTRWSGTISIMLSTLFETMILTSLILLLYIPVSVTAFAALFVAMAISVITKLIFIGRYKEDIKLQEKNQQTIVGSFTKSLKAKLPATLLFTIVLPATMFVLFPIFIGWSTLAAMLISLFAIFVINFSNLVLFPWLFVKTESQRYESKDRTKNRDITWSKSKDTIDEEYIKDINY